MYRPVYKVTAYCSTTSDEVTPSCSFTYRSSVHNNNEITLESKRDDFNMEQYQENKHYEYLSSKVVLDKRSFDCCPGLFFDEMKYTLHLKKRRNPGETAGASSVLTSRSGMTVLTFFSLSILNIMVC